MANIKSYLTEISLTVIAFVWLWFVLTNSNANLGNAYLWAAGISLFLLIINILIFDKNVNVTFQKKQGGHIEAFFAGIAGWVILLVTSFILLKIVEPAKASIGSILKATNAANPAFADSQIVNWITVSFAIGYTETVLFARLMEFISDRLGIQVNRKNRFLLSFLLLVIGLSILFAIFHITAKGVDDLASLVVVALMMAISLFMIAYFDGEIRQAIWTHITANAVAGFLLIKSGSLLFNIGVPMLITN